VEAADSAMYAVKAERRGGARRPPPR
jgi:hypothetical protein